jgi:type II secretion system protein C
VPFLVTVLLSAIILFQLLNLSWTILLPNQIPFDQSEISDHISNKNQYIELSGDPMKRNSSQALLDALEDNMPPKTSSPLKLFGITYSNSGKINFAILGFNLGEQKRYKENDLISNNITLKTIKSNFVIINRDGIRERVSFSEDSSLSIIKRKVVKLTKPSSSMKALSSLNKVMSFKPYFTNGRLEGYEISSGQEEEIFNRSGLKKGDILIAVNGLNFNDPSLAKEISSSNVRLDLLRDRKALSLMVGLN